MSTKKNSNGNKGNNKGKNKMVKRNGGGQPRYRPRSQGSGKQRVNAPVIQGSVLHSGGQPAMRVKRREFLTNVTGTATNKLGQRVWKLYMGGKHYKYEELKERPGTERCLTGL